jgi:hypothetical protein
LFLKDWAEVLDFVTGGDTVVVLYFLGVLGVPLYFLVEAVVDSEAVVVDGVVIVVVEGVVIAIEEVVVSVLVEVEVGGRVVLVEASVVVVATFVGVSVVDVEDSVFRSCSPDLVSASVPSTWIASELSSATGTSVVTIVSSSSIAVVVDSSSVVEGVATSGKTMKTLSSRVLSEVFGTGI